MQEGQHEALAGRLEVETLREIRYGGLMEFETFGERLDNWARVVRLPKFHSGVCAQWARWYVSIRDTESKYAWTPPALSKDEIDGWLVERAWSLMQHPVHKFILKYHYVWGMSDVQVITRMRKAHGVNLRGRPWELILSEAQASMKKTLVNPENLAKMLLRLSIPLRRELIDPRREGSVPQENAELVD